MSLFSSIAEKIGSAFRPAEAKTPKEAKNIRAIREHVPSRPSRSESAQSASKEPITPIDRSQRSTEKAPTDRQEAARLTSEVFAELKAIQQKTRELQEVRGGKGLWGLLDRELRTTGHGHLIGTILWGDAAVLAHTAVQTEAFSNLLGNYTAIGAVVTTLLLSRQAIKSVAETIDYYFRGERSARKDLEAARLHRKHFKRERSLMIRNYREGHDTAQEYIHYAADLVKEVRANEEAIINGSSNEGTARKPLVGMKESMQNERTHKLQRALGATIAAPVVNVLFGGQQLGINEWDMVSPSHRVEQTLTGLKFHSTAIADAVGRTFPGIPHQAWSAFTIGATSLIGKTIQEAATLAKKFDKREQEDGIIAEMEQSVSRMRELEERIQKIADATPFKGKKRLNAEHIEAVRRPPGEASPNDFSDLVGKEAKQYAGQPEPSLWDKVLGRGTRPLKPATETAPLTAQDFGESPSLFRAECLRKSLGAVVPPGTLLTQEAFMDRLEGWFANASDIDVIDRELYFSDQQHQHSADDVDESIKATLDVAARRCAAERLNRIAEKMPLTAFDPNALRARLLVLLGMDDEVAVGQKYFEKLFVQGYASATKIQRVYFNEVMRALDLSININNVTKKREKNNIFESVRRIVADYDTTQKEAA